MQEFGTTGRKRPRARRAGALFLGFFAVAAALFPAPPARAVEFFWGNPQPQGNPIRCLAMRDGSNGVAVGLLGTLLRTADAGETWTDISNWQAFPKSLYGALWLTNGDLLAVGDAPGVFRSADGGMTWSAVSNPSSQTLLHLDQIGASVFSAVGKNGQVIRSTDGGATWSLRPNPGGADLVDQFWLDAQHGYVIGPGLVRRTNDSGQTWSSLPGVQENFFLPGDIRFLDPQNGWILVDFTTYRTTDGGASWFEKHGPFGQSPIYQQEALFLDADNRYVVTEGEGAEIWKTTDDGLHWTLLYDRSSTGGYSDVRRLPSGRLLVSSTAGDLLHSDDGGASWTNFTRSPFDGQRERLYALASLPDGRCFAGGDGPWLASTDSGRNWQIPPASPAMSLVQAIAFRDDLGIVGGIPQVGQTRVARTTDGGGSWTVQALSATYTGYVVSLSLPSATTAFAATYGGFSTNYLYRSTDAGSTWTLRNAGLPVNVRFNCVFFLDEQNGFLGIGDSGDARVYRTSDGGGTWIALGTSGLNADGVFDMHWFDAARGVVATHSGLRRTTDGGSNWIAIPGTAYDRLDFRDALHGYASSIYGVYYETTDGGVSWSSVPLPLSHYYYDIAASPGGFLVAGDQTSILGGDEGTAGVDPLEALGSAPAPGFEVRALPNPARAGDDLRFLPDDAQEGPAQVEIFDAAGRSIARFPARITPGVPLRWNGNGLPAGVYAARIRDTRGRVGSGRFVLLP